MNELNTINIVPVNIWTGTGVVSANKFEVRYVTYTAPSAVADCHLWVDDGNGSVTEVAGKIVTATQQQCEAWTDDVTFFSILATNAGLQPASSGTPAVI